MARKSLSRSLPMATVRFLEVRTCALGVPRHLTRLLLARPVIDARSFSKNSAGLCRYIHFTS
jgi:hypothetical protein